MNQIQTPHTGYAPVQGGELFYEVAGAGPAVVLIHAGIADLRMWDAQVAALAPHYTVVRYDARGYGRTRSEPVAFSNRQDIADLLAHLGIGQAALVGCSRGGIIAFDTALERPELVNALVMVASMPGGFDYEAPPEEVEQYTVMEAAEQAKDWERLTDLEVRFWLDGPGQPETRVPAEIREFVRTMIIESYRNQTVEITPQPLDPPAIGRLDELKVPLLAIYGDLDASEVPAGADLLVAGVAGARKVLIPGTAHLPNLEQPEQFNAILLEFFEQALQ